MAFEFLFEDAVDSSSLKQGDLLKRNTALSEVLNQAHSYYACAESYTHFIVLTQSCDLVVRDKKKGPKAPYISIAAVRPFRLLADRILDGHIFDGHDYGIKLCDASNAKLVLERIERFIHHDEPNYFFFPKESFDGFSQDMCAFLTLSVALKPEHFQTCLEAKVAELAPEFRAKIGWLTGNIYSRVATTAIEEASKDADRIKSDIYDRTFYNSRSWLSPSQLSYFKEKINEWKKHNPGKTPTENVVEGIVDSIPDNEVLLANRVVKRLSDAKLLAKEGESAEETAERVRSMLASDRTIKALVK